MNDFKGEPPTAMRRAFKPLALCVVLMAGCVSVDDRGDGNGEPSPPWAFHGVDLAGTPHPVDSNESWSEFHVEARGEPGTWMVAYREFSRLEDASTYTVHVEAEASGNGTEPLGLYVIPPQIMWSDGWPALAVVEQADLLVSLDGTDLSYEQVREETWTVPDDAKSAGFFLVLGSTGHWSAEITVHLGHGSNRTGPSFVTVNDGASLMYGWTHRVGPSDAQIGRVELERELDTPGLVHYEYYARPMFYGIYHAYSHDCDLHWGDDRWLDCSGFGDSAMDDARIASWGRFVREPDYVSLYIEYVETTHGLDLAVLHLPGDRETMLPEILRDLEYMAQKPYWQSDGLTPMASSHAAETLITPPDAGGWTFPTTWR